VFRLALVSKRIEVLDGLGSRGQALDSDRLTFRPICSTSVLARSTPLYCGFNVLDQPCEGCWDACGRCAWRALLWRAVWGLWRGVVVRAVTFKSRNIP
jgi:hypothetical protein